MPGLVARLWAGKSGSHRTLDQWYELFSMIVHEGADVDRALKSF